MEQLYFVRSAVSQNVSKNSIFSYLGVYTKMSTQNFWDHSDRRALEMKTALSVCLRFELQKCQNSQARLSVRKSCKICSSWISDPWSPLGSKSLRTPRSISSISFNDVVQWVYDCLFFCCVFKLIIRNYQLRSQQGEIFKNHVNNYPQKRGLDRSHIGLQVYLTQYKNHICFCLGQRPFWVNGGQNVKSL